MMQKISDSGALRRWALFLTLPSLLWVLVNRSVWPFDPAWYGEVSIDLWIALTERTREWPAMCVAAFGSKAPLIAWLGQFFLPLRYFTGSAEAALLMLMVAGSFLALCLAARINRKLFENTWSAAAGLLTLASAPLFVGLSHEYFAEMLQLACVAWSVWIAARAPSRVELFFGLLAAFTIGLLIKASSPLYMIMPCGFGLWQFITGSTQKSSRTQSIIIVVAGVVATALCALWYIHNFQTVRDFVASTSSGSIALLYGSAAPLPVKLHFWAHAYRYSFFASKYIGWFWVASALAATALRFVRRGTVTRSDIFAIAAVLQITLALFVFARQTNEETRYVLPLLVYQAIAGGFIARELRPAMTPIFLAMLAAGALFVQLAAFGFAVLNVETPWLKAADFNTQPSALLTEIVRDTCTPKDAGRYTIFGVEYSSFNANSASFYMLKSRLTQNYRCYYTMLGYAETDVNRALQRIKDLHAHALVYPERFMEIPPDPFNRVSVPVEQQISKDPRVHLKTLGTPAEAMIFEFAD